MSNWIFCKDKLPDKHGRYLVVYPLMDDEPYIDILYYGIPISTENTEHPFFYDVDQDCNDVVYDDVVAWMPLPELWEGAEDDN